MKNLYKQLGYNHCVEKKQVKYDLDQGRLDEEAGNTVSYILLSDQRKQVYDRNWEAMNIIGKIRGNMRLNQKLGWSNKYGKEFVYEVDLPVSELKKLKRKAQKVNQSFFDDDTGLNNEEPGPIGRMISWIFYRVLVIGVIIGGCYLLDAWDGPAQKNNKYYDETVQEVVFKEPVQPMPRNAAYNQYTYKKPVAPLEVITRTGNGNYFVKVVDWHTKQTVMTVFVRDGRRAEITVPIGSYEIRYAAGKVWYGYEHLFGPSTVYCRAKDRFDFTESATGYSGYTIELYLQVDGNLDTEHISHTVF